MSEAETPAACDHDPESMHLMTGETATEAFVFEPKSVICGKCGRTWSFADLARERQAREQAERERDDLAELGTAHEGLLHVNQTHYEDLRKRAEHAEAELEALRAKGTCLHMDNVQPTIAGDDWCADCGAIAGGLYEDGQVSWWREPALTATPPDAETQS